MHRDKDIILQEISELDIDKLTRYSDTYQSRLSILHAELLLDIREILYELAQKSGIAKWGSKL